MRASAHVRPPDTHQEPAVVGEIRRLLDVCGTEELDRVDELMRLRRQDIALVGAALGSVDVLFWCRQRAGLTRLHEWLVNGRVRDAVKALVNRVVAGRRTPAAAETPRVAIDLVWSEHEYDVCVKYFNRFAPGRSVDLATGRVSYIRISLYFR